MATLSPPAWTPKNLECIGSMGLSLDKTRALIHTLTTGTLETLGPLGTLGRSQLPSDQAPRGTHQNQGAKPPHRKPRRLEEAAGGSLGRQKGLDAGVQVPDEEAAREDAEEDGHDVPRPRLL